MRIRMKLGSILLVAVAGCGAVLAVQPDDGAGEPSPAEAQELREEMQRYFQNRLRSELALSDEQMEQILPQIQQIERSRAQSRRSRVSIVNRLRHGLRAGATDQELQQLLDQLERIELEQRELELSTRQEIEQRLSVRQRVQFRFFIERFRREMQSEIRNLRGERGLGPYRGGMPRERR